MKQSAVPVAARGRMAVPVRASEGDVTVKVPASAHAWQLSRTPYRPGRVGWGPRSVSLMKQPPSLAMTNEPVT